MKGDEIGPALIDKELIEGVPDLKLEAPDPLP